MLLFVREEANVVRKVEIFQLFVEGPLDARVTVHGCSSHDLVNDYQEDGW